MYYSLATSPVSSRTGNNIAPIAEETTPQIIITQPLLKLANVGTYLNMHDIQTAITIIFAIGDDFFAGGIIIAINIAYKAIPNAPRIEGGKKLLENAPMVVPPTQPRYEHKIRCTS